MVADSRDDRIHSRIGRTDSRDGRTDSCDGRVMVADSRDDRIHSRIGRTDSRDGRTDSCDGRVMVADSCDGRTDSCNGRTDSCGSKCCFVELATPSDNVDAAMSHTCPLHTQQLLLLRKYMACKPSRRFAPCRLVTGDIVGQPSRVSSSERCCG